MVLEGAAIGSFVCSCWRGTPRSGEDIYATRVADGPDLGAWKQNLLCRCIAGLHVQM